jgi:hypothetical protein
VRAFQSRCRARWTPRLHSTGLFCLFPSEAVFAFDAYCLSESASGPTLLSFSQAPASCCLLLAAFGGAICLSHTFSFLSLSIQCSAFFFRCRGRRGGDGGGFFWHREESLFEMSTVLRGPPPPLTPVVLSVFLMEDDAGEPGVCEITVALPPDESHVSSPSPNANFYVHCQQAVMLQQT